jgi:glycosyltransferase involved in cell wall biosynthesis
MATSMKERLIIGYGGHLEAMTADTDKKQGWLKKILSFFLITYNESSVYVTGDRTGMALFRQLIVFRAKYPQLVDRVHFHLWGSIAPANAEQVMKMELQNLVTISGLVSTAESDKRMQDCDMMLLLQESGKNGYKPMALPSKMFEYLRCRKPVLVLSEPSDCTEILERSGLAKICAHADRNGFADTLAELISNRDRLNELFVPDEKYIAQYSFANKAEEYRSLIKSVIAG